MCKSVWRASVLSLELAIEECPPSPTQIIKDLIKDSDNIETLANFRLCLQHGLIDKAVAEKEMQFNISLFLWHYHL